VEYKSNKFWKGGWKVRIMKTLSYIYGTEQEIEIGAELYFGQLWDGNGDGEELLNSGEIAVWDEETETDNIVSFEIIEPSEDILNALVRVTDLY